jgi:hypothetical protein
MSFAQRQGSASGSYPATSARVIKKPTLSCAVAAAVAISCLLAVLAPASEGQYCRPENVQERRDANGLPLVAQAGISRAIGRDQLAYQSTPEGDGFRMANGPLSIDLRSTGVQFAMAGTSWAMSLTGYGYGDKLDAAKAVAPASESNRVEYRRGALTEWYVNGPRGFEQGFSLARAPGKAHGQPLTLRFALTGTAIPSTDPGATALTLAQNGTPTLRYGGLEAFDARGRELHTWLELDQDHLAIHVDDARAQYPITVDPFVETIKLVPCDSTSSDMFGFSAAASSDGKTIVVGAPGVSPSGAAYVFVKPGGLFGWAGAQAVAKLVPSAAFSVFAWGMGYNVGMSQDGSTIVSTPYDAGPGVYVFVRPATGWSQNSAMTETALLAFPSASGVGISGDGNTIAAGFITEGGGVGVWDKPSTGWASTSANPPSLSASQSDTDELGFSIAVSQDGSTVVAGDIGWSGNQTDQGAAFVFLRPSTVWTDTTASAVLFASDGVYTDRLGFSVAVSDDGNTVVAEKYGPVIGQTLPSAPYVFVKPATGWTPSTETAELTDSRGAWLYSIGISGDGSTIIASGDVFAKPAGGWVSSTETSRLIPSISVGSDAISDAGSTVVAGHFYSLSDAPPSDPNAAYVFTGSPAACQCATVVSGSVTVTRSGYVLNLGTGRYAQTVTVTNTSASAINGPISLVLDSLSTNASLFNLTGTTDLLQAPAGSPYITVNVNLGPGQMTAFALQFTDPTRTAITYNTRVLAGPGSL